MSIKRTLHRFVRLRRTLFSMSGAWSAETLVVFQVRAVYHGALLHDLYQHAQTATNETRRICSGKCSIILVVFWSASAFRAFP